jgi:glucose/arabinose dehydrogenase
MSGGDGASFTTLNVGDAGDSAPNTCGDPPSEGGMLRSQDRETGGDPLGLDGSIIRVDPATGSGVPGNPAYSAPGNDNRSRIIAYGLRNPCRFALRPGTSELWQADVGWYRYERIFRLPSTTPSSAVNFGWPCYEGESRGLTYIPICASPYANPSRVTAPYFAYLHDQRVVSGNKCGEGASGATTGIAFAPGGGRFSAAYNGALFFADYTHSCIYAMRTSAGGNPDPARREVFSDKVPNPVDLEFGPTGDLF